MLKQENKSRGAGRFIAGSLLGILLALLTPVILITQLMSLMTVVLVPAIGVMLLYRWAGKGPALLSVMLQLVFTARLMGSVFMWTAFLTCVLPLAILLRFAQKPFFVQLKASIAAFGGGMVAAVAALYSAYGGNLIQRVLELLPQAMRTVPVEALQMPMQTLGASLGRELTVESFYQLFDTAIATLIPQYQINLPGLLLSGALATAVVCAGLGAWLHVRSGKVPDNCFVNLRYWFIPASTTSGLLTMAIASYAIYALGMQQGQTLYTTVYSIVTMTFCVQALASFARRTHEMKMRPGARTALLVAVAVLCAVGGSLYVALYGLASAIFGRRGALRAKIENKNSDHHSDQQ